MTIYSYIEAIGVGNSRFRTLNQVIAECSAAGEPIFYTSNSEAVFDVTVNGHFYRLHCGGTYLPETIWTCNTLPCIVSCRLLTGEMLVFDSDNRPQWIDIVLEERIPDTTPFHEWVDCNRQTKIGRDNLERLLNNIAKIAETLSEAKVIHGNIRSTNTIVNRLGYPILRPAFINNPYFAQNDEHGLARMAIGIYVVMCEPKILDTINLFSRFGLQTALRHISTQAEFIHHKPLSALIETLYAPTNRQHTNLALHNLALAPPVKMPLLMKLLQIQPNLHPKMKTVATSPAEMVDFNLCDEVCAPSNTTIRFRMGDCWDYADTTGQRITNVGYAEADDFQEGLARVRVDNLYGVINCDGATVMPILYEQLDWNVANNIIIACLDGEWEVYDRMGVQLSSGHYDWLGECCEGVMVAERGGKFGYIRADGLPITTLRFDEAYSFNRGEGIAILNNKEYRIKK